MEVVRLDTDKFMRWRQLAEKFYGKDFWSQIFNDHPAKEALNNFSDFFGDNSKFPRADIYKVNREIIVIFEIPGVKKEDVELSFVGDRLKIKGVIRSPDPAYSIVISERSTGPFERILELPENLDKETVSAKFSNGLLEVRISLLDNVTVNTIKIE